MRRLTKIMIVLGALAGLAAGVLVVVPFALADRLWAEATARVAATASLRLAAEGPVRLKLFPAPRLLVSTVEVTNDTGVALAHVDRVRLELAWADVLTGRAEPARVQFRHTRLLALPQHPPVDLDIQRDGENARVAATFEGGALRAGIRTAAGAIAVDTLTVVAGAFAASGSAQVTLGSDPRAVVTLDRLERAGALLGKGGIAAALASDGLLVERVFFEGSDGCEASFFGLAAADHGVVRVEGGLEGRRVSVAGTAEATARLAASLGGETSRVELSDIDWRMPGTRLNGSLRAELGLEPRLRGEFRVDALDLDTAGGSTDMLAPFAAFSAAELRLRVGRVAWKGNLAEGVVLDLLREKDQITLRELAVRNTGGAPVYAKGTLRVVDNGIGIDSLTFRYATLEGTAKGALDLAQPVLHLRLDVALTGPLALDAIVPPLPPLPAEPTTRRAAAAAASAPRAPVAPSGWSRERFSLPALPPIRGELQLSMPRLLWRGQKLDNAEMKARIEENAFVLEALTGRLYDGRFELQGTTRMADGQPVFAGTASLQGGDLKAVLKEYAGVSDIAGHLDGTMQLSSQGNSAAELIAGLKGTARIQCRDGAITGFNLPGMSEGLKRLQRPTDLAEVFRLGTGGGRTPFSALEGGFRIERGVARTEDLKLVAKGGEIRTVGTINLAAWTVDLGNQFRLTEHPDLPPFALKMQGPMGAPRQVFDIQELQSQLVRRGRR